MDGQMMGGKVCEWGDCTAPAVLVERHPCSVADPDGGWPNLRVCASCAVIVDDERARIVAAWEPYLRNLQQDE